MNTILTRRRFIRHAASVGGGLLILPSLRSVRGAPANERLNVAIIGVGGRGKWFVDTMPKMANVVALCDVNDQRAGNAFELIPQAKKFYDFRKMLDEMDAQIDGVIVAAPDHIHAPASAMALRMGKHLYCEKPMTHSIYEARFLRDLARKSKGATQLGNQGTASESFRRATELVQAGAIGEIREVYAWNDSGGAGERPRPSGEQPIPDTLKWDLWLGPAAARPFHSQWLNWHAWRDFATGQLGNWGVHTMNLAFKALKLDALWQPNSGAGSRFDIQAEVSGKHNDTFPRSEKIRYTFPKRGDMPSVQINWCNGGTSPGTRQTIEDLLGRKLDWGDAGEKKWKDHAGLLLVGSKGRLHANGHNTVFTLLPESDFADFKGPAPTLPRSRGHEAEWLDACKGGAAGMSNFNYGGPLTEFVLLGNVATRFDGKLEYDTAAAQIVNDKAANAALKRDYREGWKL